MVIKHVTNYYKYMAQQQQSNMIKPQKVGVNKAMTGADYVKAMTPKKGAKINAGGMKMKSMDSQGAKAHKMVNTHKSTGRSSQNVAKKVAKPSQAPTLSQVQKSVRKSMGY